VDDVDSPSLNSGSLTASLSVNGQAEPPRHSATGNRRRTIGVIRIAFTYVRGLFRHFTGGSETTPLVITFIYNRQPALARHFSATKFFSLPNFSENLQR